MIKENEKNETIFKKINGKKEEGEKEGKRKSIKEGVKKDKKNSDKALFLSEQKKRISNRTVQYIVKQELQAAGIDSKKYSVHKLRHTAATLMYKYGEVDIRALQEILGHESIATTQIYTHVADEQIDSALSNSPLNDIKRKKSDDPFECLCRGLLYVRNCERRSRRLVLY